MNEKKLRDRCIVLRKIIIKVAEIYSDVITNDDQKRLIETVIGAAIWYLPTGKNLWTGKISEEALKSIDRGIQISKLTKEHEFPRKIAANEVLTSELDNLKKSEAYLYELYTTKYGKWNLVTPLENKLLGKYQKDTVFISPEDAYIKAGINLVEPSTPIFKKRNKIVKNNNNQKNK